MQHDYMVERTSDGLDATGAVPSRPSERLMVLVPRTPGPVVPVATGSGRPDDDLDAIVDEMFGPTTDERPGVFDVLLASGGVALLAWALVAGAAPWVIALGIAALVVGLALPVRSIVRRYRSASDARRLRSVGRRGYLLDVGDPSTVDLVAAHEALAGAAALPGSVYSARALDAAHGALVEVATLLDGAPPDGEEQRAYVAKRTAAIAGLAGLLADAHQRRVDAERASERAEETRRRRWVDAVTRARDELQAEDRQGSLARLDRLSRRLRLEAEDDRD